MDTSQLQQVDRCVNDIIRANHFVHSQELPLREANRIKGLRTVDEVTLSLCPSPRLNVSLSDCLSLSARLSQVYPDPVRVVSVEVEVSELFEGETGRETSVELCCGT